jgi:lipid-A-disaccharide synthase
MAVVYKLPKLDYAIFSRMVKTPHAALINLIAGQGVVKELIQTDFNAKDLANELLRLIEPTTTQICESNSELPPNN